MRISSLQEKPLADYFEDVIDNLKTKTEESYQRRPHNWTMVDVLRVVNTEKMTILPIFRFPRSMFAGMMNLIVDRTISGKIAKDVFEEMLRTKEFTADNRPERKGLVQMSNTGAIGTIVDEVLAKNT